MPQVVEIPRALRPYRFHGLAVEPNGSANVGCECPFCGKEKFSVNVENGLWRCLVCNEGAENGKASRGGNAYTFLQLLHKVSNEDSAVDQYVAFAKDRGLMTGTTLTGWGACRSVVTSDWLLPGHNPEGKLTQLYRYARPPGQKRPSLLATSELPHGLFGVPLYRKDCETVYLCEGPWDAMALREVLACSTPGSDGKLVYTTAPEVSLLMTASVLAAPGANVFREDWLPLFAGKRLVLLYDSDHPGKHPRTGQPLPPVGHEAMRRICGVLSGAPEPPRDVRCVQWGPEGYDPGLKSGYDVRDCLTEAATMQGRVRRLGQLLDRVRPIPDDWVGGRSLASRKSGGVEIEPLPCEDYATLVRAWRRALKWTPGLDRALAVMLACVASTRMTGDQLWVQVISPPSTGKSELCEALAVARKWVKSVGNFRGFHSGFQTDADAEQDHSLLSQLRDKTLVTKDGDTILKSPNRDQALAEARDAFDTNCSVSYRNSVKREYVGLRFTWVLCGTEALLELDSADLGARFLTCIIMRGIDPELETDVNRRKFLNVMTNRGREANGTPETHDEPNKLLAKRLTGGYVNYLRENAHALLGALDDSNADELVDAFDALAQFVAYARARPSKGQDEVASREMSARLNSQLTRLALCLAAVTGRPRIDDAVMARVRQVALDTARGKTLEVVRILHDEGRDKGASTAAMAAWSHRTDAEERKLLNFLRKIGVVEQFDWQPPGHAHPKKRWRLTETMLRLYREVQRPGDEGILAT